MVCVLLKFSAVEQHGDSGWNVTCLPWYQALHLFNYPPCPSQVFHTIEIYVTVHYFTNSKAAAFTSHKNQRPVNMRCVWAVSLIVPLYCGGSKKKLSLCLHVYEKAVWTACRILGCLKRDLVKRVTGRTGQTGQCIQLLNRACSPHINRPSVQWRSCETVPTTDFFFILECLTIGCRNKAAYKKKVVI